METRVAIIAVIIESDEFINEVNSVLHEYRSYIIGRMGLPYRKAGISIISIAVDAPQNVINTISGKIGRLSGISTKTVYSNVILQSASDDFKTD